MKTVLITGGTGLIGTAIRQVLLEKGYRVIILSRQADIQSKHPNLSFAQWDVKKQTTDRDAIAAADYIIHLAGAGVADKRWTEKRKKEIRDSRVSSSALIVSSLQSISNKVKAVISASAIGWYGEDTIIPNPAPFIETNPPDKSFLGTTCKEWEGSIEPVIGLGKRLVTLRTGIVLSLEGGALKEFITPLSFGIAAILGSGKQIVSWIHINDLVNLYIAAIENESMKGVYNAVAPKPVSNKELIISLAKRKNKFHIPLKVPAWLLKMILGEMSIEILKSCTVAATKTEATDFVFSYSTLQEALDQLIKN